MKIIDKVFGTHSEREIKRIMPLVEKIEGLRPQMQALSDEELAGKLAEFKDKMAEEVMEKDQKMQTEEF